MRICEIVKWLEAKSSQRDIPDTCDVFKVGEPDKKVNKVAVAMFATVSVIKDAIEWGADFMIVHEPLYYNHYDVHSDEKIESLKRELLENSGITVYRYHDYAHFAKPDVIASGMLCAMELDGKIEYTDTFDLVRVALNDATSPKELAGKIEQKLNINKVRIAGCSDVPVKKISCMFGAPGGLLKELRRDECEVLIAGEVSEWSLCEYARDATELGYPKSVLVLGHIGSERDGMKYLAKQMTECFSEIEVKYFECGEVYS